MFVINQSYYSHDIFVINHKAALGVILNDVPLTEQVSVGYGPITSHALMSLEARGTLFVSPGMEVGANPFCYFMYYMLYRIHSFWIIV